MSLVIAIRDKDRFILGADKQVSGWNNKNHTATKIWFTEYEGCCIGSVGYARASQVIQFIKGLLDNAGFGKDALDDAFIHLQLPRTIYETLKAHGVVIDNPEQTFTLPNAFFIAYCKQTTNMHAENPYEHAYMYYVIYNIVLADINKSEETRETSDIFLSHVKEVIKNLRQRNQNIL